MVTPGRGHASGWFFQYPGVPVPGFVKLDWVNPKSVSLSSSSSAPHVTVATLLPSPSGTPSLSASSSVPTLDVVGVESGGI